MYSNLFVFASFTKTSIPTLFIKKLGLKLIIYQFTKIYIIGIFFNIRHKKTEIEIMWA